MRVVSLVPSVTETLIDWGVVPVACTRFCERPELPHVGGTKDPDIAAIVALRPDLVVVDEEENRRQDAESLVAAGLAVHVMAVRSIDDVHTSLSELAVAVGASVATVPLAARVARAGPRVAVLIWRRPWMALGTDTYGASLLEHLGFDVVSVGEGRYPTIQLADLRGVDRVLLPTEPYAFGERHVREVQEALPDAQVDLIDGQDLFWWGSRTTLAIDRLRRALS